MDFGMDAREAMFARLTDELQHQPIAGVKWIFGRSASGQPALLLRADGQGMEVQIEIVWPGDVWRRHVPSPGVEPHYRVALVRLNKHNICFPEEPIGSTADISVVLNSLAAWSVAPAPSHPQVGEPIGKRELSRLKAIAQARTAAAQNASLVTIDHEAHASGKWTASEMQEMARRIAVEFPRDDDGRLPLGATLLLEPVGPPAENELLRSQWLAALGPAKRRDPQVIAVGVHSLIPANHPYRWDGVRNWWDPRLPAPTDDERWGIAGLDPSRLGSEGRDTRIVELQKTVAKPAGTAADRAALCILLQDAGRFGEAFALFGVEANEDVWRVVSGEMLHRGLDKEQASWTSYLHQTFRTCAPWLIKQVIDNEVARQRAWAAEKKGRSRKAPRFRINALPHQTQVSKTSLMLTAANSDGDRPRFELEGVGSNLRLAEVLWQRPIDLDIRRFGLG